MLNARIRKRWLKGGAPIGVIGATGRSDLSTTDHLGAGPETLAHALDKPFGGRGQANDDRRAPARFARPDGVAVLASLAKAPALRAS